MGKNTHTEEKGGWGLARLEEEGGMIFEGLEICVSSYAANESVGTPVVDLYS